MNTKISGQGQNRWRHAAPSLHADGNLGNGHSSPLQPPLTIDQHACSAATNFAKYIRAQPDQSDHSMINHILMICTIPKLSTKEHLRDILFVMRRSHALCAVRAPTARPQELEQRENSAIRVAGGVLGAFAQSALETTRAARFWSTVLAIWGRYKVTQVRVAAAEARGDKEKAETLWARRHAHEAESMWDLCVEMRGFYVKAGQLIALQAFVPTVIRMRLAQLQDSMPAMSATESRYAIDAELAHLKTSSASVFSEITLDSTLGSASIAQVHWGRLRGNNTEVAVKIQFPSGERRMTNDLNNFKFLTALLQRTEFNFDLVSPVKELALQISYEFDFLREARAMSEIRRNIGTVPGVDIPSPFMNLSTRRLLVMEFVQGVPLSKLNNVMKDIGKRQRKELGRRVLHKMANSYGEMILTHGFFQADCHPGNVVVTNGRADIALLDFGQTKRLDKAPRLQFARLVDAIARRDPGAVDVSMRALGMAIVHVPGSDDKVGDDKAGGSQSQHRHRSKLSGAEKLAYTMFDTADVPGVSNNPFADDSALRSVTVDSFPPNLFFLLRTVQILKGICNATGNSDFSVAKLWAPLARRALKNANVQAMTAFNALRSKD